MNSRPFGYLCTSDGTTAMTIDGPSGYGEDPVDYDDHMTSTGSIDPRPSGITCPDLGA